MVLGVALVAVTVMVALKVPGAKPAVFTFTATVPLPEPEAGLNVSQEALSLALQVSVPPPVFAILMVLAAGFAPPTLSVKDRLVGLSPMVGLVLVDVVTVNMTGTDLVVPPPEMVALPL
jgi:hypothetical protein